jgi:branched-chain amino acid aminotransferase
MECRYVYLDGSIVPSEEAALSPHDIGLLRGYAVFDLLRTVGGRPFLLAEHLGRLRTSASHLGLTVPASDAEIADAIVELLDLNGHEEATVRLVLTGGVSPDGMTFDPRTPTFLILTHDLHPVPDSVYESGTILLTEEHRREIPEAKTTNYLTMLRNRDRLNESRALDLLYHDAGSVSEAASASFFIVRGETIIAPSERVLWGTVADHVLREARDRFSVQASGFTVDEALQADEAFLTSTTRGVVPIVGLDDRDIGDGTVGPVTRILMEVWDRAVSAG